jgi:hypothetical protein
MMRLIYEGKVYAGQLSKAMQGMINGRRPYFALTEETQQVEENDVVGTGLLYYLWKVSMILQSTEAEIMLRINQMTLPRRGPLSGWRSAYYDIRNEYVRLSSTNRSGTGLFLLLQAKAGDTRSGKSWFMAMETWKRISEHRESEWTEALIDKAVDYVFSDASILGDMEHWVREPEDSDESDGGVKKPAGKGKRTTGSKSIGVMQTTKAADTQSATEEKTQIIEKSWCNLQHRGHRHLKGCAKRYGKKD